MRIAAPAGGRSTRPVSPRQKAFFDVSVRLVARSNLDLPVEMTVNAHGQLRVSTSRCRLVGLDLEGDVRIEAENNGVTITGSGFLRKTLTVTE